LRKKMCVLFAAAVLLLMMAVSVGAGYVRDSGQCGPEVNWQISGIDEGEYAEYLMLEMNGQGDMWNYGSLDDCYAKETPFKKYNGSIAVAKLPEGLTSIGSYSFYYCQILSEINIPSTVTKIEASAFQDCRYTKGELNLPDGLTKIGNYAFYNCQNVKKEDFVLPEGLTYLGDNAFAQCYGLKADGLVIPEGVSQIGYAAFRNCRGLEGDLHIPAGVERINGAAFEGTRFTAVYFYGDAPDGYLFNGNYSVGLPAGAVLYYPVDAAGWTDSEHYDATSNTWNGHEVRPWTPGEVSLAVEQELEDGSALIAMRNYTTEAVSGRLWCAAYTAEGKMLAINSRDVTLELTQSEEIKIPMDCHSSRIDYLKVFLLDENTVPIAKSA